MREPAGLSLQLTSPARRFQALGSSSNGILGGVANGVVASAGHGDLPYVQKSRFSNILVSGCTGTDAFKITAGAIHLIVVIAVIALIVHFVKRRGPQAPAP